MREAKFNTEITNSLKRAGAWAWKIPDQPASWTYRSTRFTPEKPSDILACYGGLMIAVEGKMMKRFQAFGLRDLRPSQIRNLTEIVKAGGRAFVFLNVRISGKRGAVIKGEWTGRNYENRLIVLDWAKWGLYLDILSLKAKEIKALPFIVGRKGAFDLSRFLLKLDC